MSEIVRNLWLIPALPMLAAGVCALLKRGRRRLSAGLAIGAMAGALGLSVAALVEAMRAGGAAETFNFVWLQFGTEWLKLGWVLNPLTAVMLVMVSFVGLLIFIYSVGYMETDENFGRFFCFLALFAGAMLGVVISNSLLLLFMCWELVGLTSYLLIGFWFEKPSAAAAAKKAFIVTRIGDLGFFLGMMWLYAGSGTLLFYDHGAGCLEHTALARLVAQAGVLGLPAAGIIAILIFCGAAGKSGQVPLHVWLPDAMEGPTPVSALIHAATMVAAGVFLMARIYPLLAASAANLGSAAALGSAASVEPTPALMVVTWVGAITAVFAAVIAVGQYDIKRILAYSTVSQLGYMMMGIGVGGAAVGMFHLITHAFFKALLFLGAGSVIHGCGGEQDIRKMGGLRKLMPVTFAAYTAGMLALCGLPLVVSGFWSKDAILHAASEWSVSHVPFYLGTIGALLTAFYMTRQMAYVFAGTLRLPEGEAQHGHGGHHAGVHESPAVMTVPLVILAVFAVGLGFIGTPAWPWFQSFLNGGQASFELKALAGEGMLAVMATSSVIVLAGLGLGWMIYGRRGIASAEAPDAVGAKMPAVFATLGAAFYVDALYAATVVRLNNFAARMSARLDRWVFGGAVRTVTGTVSGLAHLDRFTDETLVNGGFDEGCESVTLGGLILSLLQGGRVQNYMRGIGTALVVLAALMMWGAR